MLAEEARRARGYYALGGQFIESGAGLVGGVQLQNRVGPERAGFELLADKLVNPLVPDANKTLNVPLVVVNNPIPQRKNIHSRTSYPQIAQISQMAFASSSVFPKPLIVLQ